MPAEAATLKELESSPNGWGHKTAFCAIVEMDVLAFTVIVPEVVTSVQKPEAVIVYGNEPGIPGVPLMLMEEPETEKLTPSGNPDTAMLVEVSLLE